LVELQRELQETAAKGRFTAPENLHLTLVFLGDCDTGQTTVVKSLLDATVFAPFDIWIDRVGRFRREGGDICWAGLAENRALEALQQDLAQQLRQAGFSIETRRFSPHITLARQVVTQAWERESVPFGERVTKIELMQSQRPQGGALTYAAIHTKGAII